MADSILDILGYFSPEAINARAEAAGNADYRTTAPGGPRPLPFVGDDGSSEPLSIQLMRDTQDFVPVLGDIIAVGDAADALSEGRRKEAALLGGAAMVGLIPGVGDVLARPITAAARRSADEFLDQYPSDDLGYFHSAYVPTPTHMKQMAQPGYQFNAEEVSYLNRVNEARDLQDAGATDREIFEQTNIMLTPMRDLSGNVYDEVALTATPRSGPDPTQLRPDARQIIEQGSNDPVVGDLVDLGPDIAGLAPSGGPKSTVLSEDLGDLIDGEYRLKTNAPDEFAVSSRLPDDEFNKTIAHEAEHAVQQDSGLPPEARGMDPSYIENFAKKKYNLDLDPDEVYAFYQANLGEILARRAEGDDQMIVPAGIMQLLNPLVRTNMNVFRPTASVPANVFESNRNPFESNGNP